MISFSWAKIEGAKMATPLSVRVAFADHVMRLMSEHDVQVIMDCVEEPLALSNNQIIILNACFINGIEILDFLSDGRERRILLARQYFTYMVIELAQPEYWTSNIKLKHTIRRDIAKAISKHPTNVNNIIKRVKNYIQTDKVYRDKLRNFKLLIEDELNLAKQ